MRENKSLIVYKESFFVKLKNFFKNIFDKKNSKEVHHELAENEIHVEHYANSKNKSSLDSSLSYRSNCTIRLLVYLHCRQHSPSQRLW